jgi:hypothetical protein
MRSPEKEDKEGNQSEGYGPETDKDGKKDLIDKNLLHRPEI